MLRDSAFNWTGAREKAAALLAEDRLSDEEISTDCGVTRQTLARWKQAPEFQARIDTLVSEFRARVRRRGIAILERRVAALQDRWERLQQVIQERAEELDGECPGGSTGLLTRQLKVIGRGEDAREVEEFSVDTGLLKELREHEKQAAQELGQWTERKEHLGEGGGPLVVKVLRDVSMDDL